MKSLKGLENYRLDKYSQNGENGVVDELLKRLEIDAGFLIEFGANDAYYASNTMHLIERGDWCGVYIEPGPKFHQLMEIGNKYENLLTLKMSVHTRDMPEYTPGTSLDEIIQKYCPDCDLVSIDIDSYDYHIFRTLNYRPKIIIIEVNPFIVPWVHYIDRQNPDIYGSSFNAMMRLGAEKRYVPVIHTGTNIFFVRDDIAEFYEVPSPGEEMFDWKFIQEGDVRFDENNILTWDNGK